MYCWQDVTSTIPKKLEIIRRLENGKNLRLVMTLYDNGSSTSYDIKKQKDQL